MGGYHTSGKMERTTLMTNRVKQLLIAAFFSTALIFIVCGDGFRVKSMAASLEDKMVTDGYHTVDGLAPGYRTAFRRGARVLFSNPAYFSDPHCLMAIGLLRKRLVAEFGKHQVDAWAQRAVSEICLVNNGNDWVTAKVLLPYLPNHPYCIAKANTHAGAQLLLALVWNDLSEIRRPDWDKNLVVTKDHLVRWLQQQPQIDDLSPGIGLQAFICAGVTPADTWQSENGKEWNIKKRLEAVVARWRENREKAALKPGDHIPDRLLHLAPALIDLFIRFPETIKAYEPVLQEVFSFYAEIQHPDGYWGFPGEAFATGHIVEQYIRAKKAGLPLRLSYQQAIGLMIDNQSEAGWLGGAKYRTTGLHSHGLRALGMVLEDSGSMKKKE